jgi:hypothetical protein
MLKIFVGLLLLVSLAADQAGVAQDSAEPPDHGAYYKAKDGWQKLEILNIQLHRPRPVSCT